MKEFIEFIESNNISLEIPKIEEKNLEIKKIEDPNKNLITLNNLLYILGIISLIGFSIFLYNNGWFNLNENINKIGHLNELDAIGITLYKLSVELSKSCTVFSWESIHLVLKSLDSESFNGLELITELEKLNKLNKLFPGKYSTNSESFEKSLINLINFLKKIL